MLFVLALTLPHIFHSLLGHFRPLPLVFLVLGQLRRHVCILGFKVCLFPFECIIPHCYTIEQMHLLLCYLFCVICALLLLPKLLLEVYHHEIDGVIHGPLQFFPHLILHFGQVFLEGIILIVLIFIHVVWLLPLLFHHLFLIRSNIALLLALFLLLIVAFFF